MGDIKELLSKSSGVNLIKHSKNVSFVSEFIGEQILKNPTEKEKRIIKIGGLLHDIGKCVDEFQKILKNENKKTGFKFLHNEIGWAFLHKYLNTEHLNVNSEMIINMVHWHHGILNSMNTTSSDEILDEIGDENIMLLKHILIDLMGDNSVLKTPRNKKMSPLFYKKEDDYEEYNEFFSILRTCVISADQIVSNLEKNDIDLTITQDNFKNILPPIISSILNKKENIIIEKPFEFDEDRFITQKEIINNCENTTIVKAPAGFGKTMVGLLWSTKNNKKTIWVTPRNVVAKSVYQSLINEINILQISVNVELFLTGGEIYENNHNNSLPQFSSDIIVTNIDNFISPTISEQISDRLFLIHTANVVFDEYHEFVTDLPIFASFVNLMRSRHMYTNCETILLSATPIKIWNFWEGGIKTKILPNVENHYFPIHDRKYLIRVINELNHDLVGSDIILYNSIFESQLKKSKTPNSILFHSEFEEVEKNEIFKSVMEKYGKKSEMVNNKPTLIATLIAQASLDISGLRLYDSLMSPETSIQRIGRLGRFKKDYNEQLTYTLFRPQSKSEKYVVNNIHYDEDLSELWYNEMLKYNNQYLTLSEIYQIYNDHIKKHEKIINKFLKTKYNISIDILSQIYPRRNFFEKSSEKNIKADSNKLRSIGTEIFYTTREYDVQKREKINRYVTPFSTPIRKSFGDDFGEDGNIFGKLMKSIKHLNDQKDSRFDYNKILKMKKLNIDILRKYSKFIKTPYINFKKVYVKGYGLIDENRLGLLNL